MSDPTPGPTVSTCEPFTTIEDIVGCWPSDEDKGEELIELAIQAASDWMDEKLNRQFRGVCRTLGLPCPACGCGGGSRWGWWGGAWTWWLSGGGGGSCRCGPYPKIDLGPDPVVEVIEVRHGGVVIDPATYRVDDWRYLIRLTDADGSNPGWPGPINRSAALDAEGSLSVEWRHGYEVPPLVRLATRAVAHQLLLACPGADGEGCALPPNATQALREGITISLRDFNAAVAGSSTVLTNLLEVSMAIEAYNPDGDAGIPTITDPDEAPAMVYPT